MGQSGFRQWLKTRETGQQEVSLLRGEQEYWEAVKKRGVSIVKFFEGKGWDILLGSRLGFVENGRVKRVLLISKQVGLLIFCKEEFSFL